MKTIFYTAIVILSFISSLHAQNTVSISRGSSVTIDGKIEETEWQDASSFDLKGGGKVFFKYDGNYLFVGVRGLKNGWSHLYLSQENNSDISVLHASAALGMTVYKKDENENWQSSNPFVWDVRDSIINTETKQKMAAYLEKNYWVANNNNMGNPTEIEFQIKPRNSVETTFYVAVVYAANAKMPQYFPSTLNDDTIKEDLIYGNTPNDLKFDKNKWAKVILEKSKQTK